MQNVKEYLSTLKKECEGERLEIIETVLSHSDHEEGFPIAPSDVEWIEKGKYVTLKIRPHEKSYYYEFEKNGMGIYRDEGGGISVPYYYARGDMFRWLAEKKRCEDEPVFNSDDEDDYSNTKVKTDGKKRLCPGYRVNFGQQDRDPHNPFTFRHEYTTAAYLCEECEKFTCKDCTLDDEWNDRVRDGVFLCLTCYHNEMARRWHGMY